MATENDVIPSAKAAQAGDRNVSMQSTRSETSNKATQQSKLDGSHGNMKQEIVQESGFFRLPCEIRNDIYGFCLIADKTVVILAQTDSWDDTDDVVRGFDEEDDRYIDLKKVELHTWSSQNFDGWTPGLAVVSRQIHQESNPILYGRNKFSFSDWKEFYCFTKISRHSAKHLRHIRAPFPLPIMQCYPSMFA